MECVLPGHVWVLLKFTNVSSYVDTWWALTLVSISLVPIGDHRRVALLFCTKYSVCRLLRCTAGTFEAVRCRVLMTQCGLNGTGTEKMILQCSAGTFVWVWTWYMITWALWRSPDYFWILDNGVVRFRSWCSLRWGVLVAVVSIDCSCGILKTCHGS